MSHDNRSRITIDPNGKCRLYQAQPLPGWEFSGTVTRGDGDTGALVRNKTTGVYAQANAGALRSLDQRKAKAALGISNSAGRPAELADGKRVNVYLDAGSLKRAAELGNGNVSEGIRQALLGS